MIETEHHNAPGRGSKAVARRDLLDELVADYKAFRAQNIEIAFPQRDFNLRSVEKLGDFVKKREDLTEDER